MSVETNRSFVLPFCIIGFATSNPVATAIEFAPPLATINAVWGTTEDERQVTLGITGQISNFTVHCRDFTADVNPTVRTRVGQVGARADGNQIVTITAAGIFTDLTNFDVMARLDQFDWEFDHVTGSTTNFIIQSIANCMESQ